jgi:hypothetical protein
VEASGWRVEVSGRRVEELVRQEGGKNSQAQVPQTEQTLLV